MKKLSIIVLAMLAVSCSPDFVEDYTEQESTQEVCVSSDDYATMYEFVEMLANLGIFGVDMPCSPTYDALMQVSADVVLMPIFGDTVGECDCEKVYRLMLAYFLERQPDAKITSYLQYILDNGMY